MDAGRAIFQEADGFNTPKMIRLSGWIMDITSRPATPASSLTKLAHNTLVCSKRGLTMMMLPASRLTASARKKSPIRKSLRGRVIDFPE